MKKRLVNFRLRADLADELDAKADALGVSKTLLIEECLDESLAARAEAHAREREAAIKRMGNRRPSSGGKGAAQSGNTDILTKAALGLAEQQPPASKRKR